MTASLQYDLAESAWSIIQQALSTNVRFIHSATPLSWAVYGGVNFCAIPRYAHNLDNRCIVASKSLHALAAMYLRSHYKFCKLDSHFRLVLDKKYHTIVRIFVDKRSKVAFAT